MAVYQRGALFLAQTADFDRAQGRLALFPMPDNRENLPGDFLQFGVIRAMGKRDIRQITSETRACG